MSSFNVGLGSWKKGGRVADSSMLTRNTKLIAMERGVTTEINQLRLGPLGIPTFKTPAAFTIQTAYAGTTPAIVGALNSAVMVRRRIRE